MPTVPTGPATRARESAATARRACGGRFAQSRLRARRQGGYLLEFSSLRDTGASRRHLWGGRKSVRRITSKFSGEGFVLALRRRAGLPGEPCFPSRPTSALDRDAASAGHGRGVQQEGLRAMTSAKPKPPLIPGESRPYPVLPLPDIVVFPHMLVPLFVGREKSIRALEEAMRSDTFILLATQKNASDDDPKTDSIFEVGTLASVLQLLKLPDGTVKVLVEGAERAEILSYNERTDYYA